MGCDIHTYSERLVDGNWHEIEHTPLDCRSYGLFGWLADVRNYSAIIPIAAGRGLPNDVCISIKTEYEDDADIHCAHSVSWVLTQELYNFDYDQICEDRRCTRRVETKYGSYLSGGETCEPGEGIKQTYREFLGEWYFEELDKLKEFDIDRVVFWFDN